MDTKHKPRLNTHTHKILTGGILPRGLLTAYGISSGGRLTGVAKKRGFWPGGGQLTGGRLTVHRLNLTSGYVHMFRYNTSPLPIDGQANGIGKTISLSACYAPTQTPKTKTRPRVWIGFTFVTMWPHALWSVSKFRVNSRQFLLKA